MSDNAVHLLIINSLKLAKASGKRGLVSGKLGKGYAHGDQKDRRPLWHFPSSMLQH